MTKRAIVVMLAFALPLLVAGSADAYTTVNRVGDQIHVTARSGDVDNYIDIYEVEGWIVVRDFAGANSDNYAYICNELNGIYVRCQPDGVTQVVVVAGNGADVIHKTIALPGRLDGGDGHDTIDAGPATTRNVLLGGRDDDRLFGGPNSDVLDGGPGGDTLRGGAGRDVAEYSSRSAPVTVDLTSSGEDAGERWERDSIGDVEDVVGGSGDDVLVGSAAANALSGGAGADTLRGLGGDDVIRGGTGGDVHQGDDGQDTFVAEASGDGADVFSGGAGLEDRVSYANRSSAVTADIDGVADDGAPGELDNVRTDVERLTGGTAGDSLTGSAAGNRLDGGLGADRLLGLGGDDRLTGHEGADSLEGGAGADYLFGLADADGLDGGTGNDYLYGGDGDDDLYGFDSVSANDRLDAQAGRDACAADSGDAQISCEESAGSGL